MYKYKSMIIPYVVTWDGMVTNITDNIEMS